MINNKLGFSIPYNAIVLFMILYFGSKTMAQNANDRVNIIKQTNTIALKKISEEAKRNYTTSLAKSINRRIQSQIRNSKNEIGYLSGFDKNGNPVYDFDDNLDAAITNRVNKIWNEGTTGLNLDGAGVLIGHWEAGGLASSTHQELKNRISYAESAAVTGHATHTAGTMIGEGINYSARGMANAAKIVSRRSNNDEAEIADFAAAGGILSNHSYSTGDPDGDIPLYGKYTENAAEWDEIMYNAPYLLMSKSSGNNRNDGVNEDDGGYDIVYSVATCKNLLTVGAVYDVSKYYGPESVDQSEFSNWGPTDDWRIKPDIVTSGVSVRSANNTSNTAYQVRNGTSMAAAVATGSIALLQQHYHDINGRYMRSATVKALLICTAEEAGPNDGPDFQSGWGLINAESAAKAISNNGEGSLINELQLLNGYSFRTEIEVDGSLPLSAVIAWTDLPGTPMIGNDNQTPILVNDLDIRITRNNSEYKPWVLTPNITSNNFSVAAIKGDNFRDNIERIDIPNPSEGIYTISISHKGTLFEGKQDYSLVVHGIRENVLAIEDMDKNSSLSIYPVPSKDGIMNVSIPNNYNSASYKLELFDVFGKLRKAEVFFTKEFNLNLSALGTGIYFVKLELDSRILTKTIIIDK